MDKDLILLFTASAAGLLLQLLIRISSRTGDKKQKLILNIGKCGLILVIQFILMEAFTLYGSEGTHHAGCVIASCITFIIGIAVLLMQFFFDRRYPMTDEQRMLLNEL